MKISEAVEVVEAHGQDAANDKLAEGWKLLAVIHAQRDSVCGLCISKEKSQPPLGVLNPRRKRG